MNSLHSRNQYKCLFLHCKGTFYIAVVKMTELASIPVASNMPVHGYCSWTRAAPEHCLARRVASTSIQVIDLALLAATLKPRNQAFHAVF